MVAFARQMFVMARAAPELITAAVVASIIAAACAINFVVSFGGASQVNADNLRSFETYNSNGTPAGVSLRERKSCLRVLEKQRPTEVTARSRDKPYLRDSNSVTLADPYARGLVPVYPDVREFAAYRERFYLARPALTGVDLASRSAVMSLSLYARSPVGSARAHEFPRGTRLFLRLFGASGTELEVTSPVTEATQVTVPMPLNGSTNTYPEDTYFAALGPATIRAAIPGHRDSYYAIDFTGAFKLASVTREVKVTQVPGIFLRFPDGNVCRTRFGFIVKRAGADLFIWLMATIPIVLLLLIISAFREARSAALHRKDPGSHVFGGSAATQAAVAFLAILPLRAVLVPSQISSITRVDFLLGAELALLVFALCVGALWVRREHTTIEPPPRPTDKGRRKKPHT